MNRPGPTWRIATRRGFGIRASSGFLSCCSSTSDGRLPVVSERGREDVAHLPVRVPTLLTLTCDLTNSQSRRNSSQESLSRRFYFYHPAPRSLALLPPPFMRKRLASCRGSGRADALIRCSPRCVTKVRSMFYVRLSLFFLPRPDFEDLFDDDDIQ